MASLKIGLGGLAGFLLLLMGIQAQAQDAQSSTSDQVSVYRQQPLSYLTGSVGSATLKFNGGSVNMPTLGVGMGGMINDYAGVEIRLVRSVMRGDYQQSQFAIEHLASALGTLRFPVWRFIYGQAYAGLSNTKLMYIDPAGGKSNQSGSGLSYGMDFGIRVVPHWRVSAGYTRYISKSDWKVTAVEGSLQYLF